MTRKKIDMGALARGDPPEPGSEAAIRARLWDHQVKAFEHHLPPVADRVVLPSVTDLARMSNEEWEHDWSERANHDWGYVYIRDLLLGEVKPVVERMQKNSSRKHLVDRKNRQERSEEPYIIHGLVPMHVPVWIWGRLSAGKTLTGIDLACHLAAGKKWMGHEVERSKVLFIQIEDSEKMMHNRIDAWESVHGDVDDSHFQFEVNLGFRLTGTETVLIELGAGEVREEERPVRRTKSVADLIELLQEDDFDVVIIDNLASAWQESNMSDTAVKAVTQVCHQIVNEGAVTLFVVAHSNEKDESIAGLTALQNLFNTALHVRIRGDKRIIKLTRSKTLNKESVKEMVFDIVDSSIIEDETEGKFVGVVRFSGPDDNIERLIMQAVYALSDDLPVTKQAIEDQIKLATGKGVNRNRLHKVIADLIEDGKLVIVGSKIGLPA